MDLDTLRSVQASERSTDSLQSLSDSFYRDVVDYIEGLREDRSRAAERAADPFGSEEVRRLTDEIETAQEVAEAIYERRIGKVVKRASLAAAGMSADEEGLTDEEARLFSDLVEEIESHRESVLSAFAGEEFSETADGATVSGASAGDATDSDDRPANTAADSTGGTTAEDSTDGTTAAESPGGMEEPPSADEDLVDPDSASDPTAAADSTDGAFDASTAMGDDAGSDTRPDEGIPTDSEDPAETEPTPPVEQGGSRTEGDGGSESAHERDSGANPDELGTDARDPGSHGAAGSTDSGEIVRTTVRITRDVGEIMGVDEHVYDLAAEDVVTLPRANAEPLLERDAASRID